MLLLNTCWLLCIMKAGASIRILRKAFFWYQKAVRQGEVSAQHELAIMYHDGHGIDQNFKQALYWFRLSAEQGYATAQDNIGLMYVKGEGVSQDFEQAFIGFICPPDKAMIGPNSI